jgi:DNA-binding LytR/AlgR family response regulator
MAVLLIGICDGDTAVRVMLSDFIKRYKDETGINVQVLSYDNGEKLLRHYPFEMDLIFLEIPFTRMNGIEIARRIRKVDNQVGIVFLTTVLNHVLEAYEVKANNYLIKPLVYARFLKEVELARARRGQNRFFLETNDRGVYKIYTKSISFIETEGHNTRIHTENDSILSYKRMKEHEKKLFESHFVRCHTAYIVNLLFFGKLEQSSLILLSGERIPVSRQRKKEVVRRINSLFSERTEP